MGKEEEKVGGNEEIHRMDDSEAPKVMMDINEMVSDR